MVTRVVTEDLCNACFIREAAEVPATFTEEIKVGEAVRVLLLCEQHRQELAALLVFVDRFGEEPAGRGDAPAPSGFGCTFCEGVFPSPGARAKHVRQDHRGHHQLKAAPRIEVGSLG